MDTGLDTSPRRAYRRGILLEAVADGRVLARPQSWSVCWHARQRGNHWHRVRFIGTKGAAVALQTRSAQVERLASPYRLGVGTTMGLNRILVASDLTEGSERALDRALRLIPDPVQLTVLHVVPSGLPPHLVAEQQKSAKSFLAARLPQGAAGRLSVVVPGNAFSTIIGEAIARTADLIVIGKPDGHPYADLFKGTTAELVIRFSDRPVLMVKQAPRKPYRQILVAFDGSEGAVRALRTALAMAPDAEFRVLHAWWGPRVAFGDIEAARQVIQDENKCLKELIANAAKQAMTASGASAKMTIDLVESNPYIAISNQCSGADLLVMGTHSKGRLASTVSVGRLATHLLVESSCDVLTSRP